MKRHIIWFLLLAAMGAAADIATKDLVFRHLKGNDEVQIIDGWFAFGHTYNRGIVFGIGQEASKIFLWISILAVPAIAAIFFSIRQPKWVMTASLGLILGGTIGNMTDRISIGMVRDFIKFYYRDGAGREHTWPLFNIADSCICVGVALLTLEMLFFDEKKRKKPAEPAPPAEATAPPTPPAPSALT